MIDLIREAPLGQAIRLVSRNRFLQYPEEKDDFELPLQYIAQLEKNEKPIRQNQSRNSSDIISSSVQSDDIGESIPRQEDLDIENLRPIRTTSSIRTEPYSNNRMQIERELELLRTKSVPIAPQKTSDGIILVDWYTTDDPANPQNWSSLKKYFVVFVICIYTWTVYCAGPTYAAAEEGIQKHFGVSAVASTVGLSLYVLAYGVGDLLFSPLTEIPIIGRNPVYFLTFIIFWVLSFPAAVVNNFSGLLALRFWTGFFGSPALANGGATVGDMFSLIYIPFGLSWWVFSAWAGPAFGPLIGGFAAQAKGWRWPMWEIVWMASIALLFLLTLMPETSPSNILLRRARRLRKLTGESRLQSQSEIDQRHIKATELLVATLIRPMQIMMKDPSIFFVNLYTGYFYGVFYTFFEVFPLVFPVFYSFNLGQTGLTFLSCFIGVSIAIGGYFIYLQFYMMPDNLKNGFREQEHRLVPAIAGSFLLPIGLFIFAWTANSNIPCAIPLIGVGIFVIGHFWVMQSLFIYLPFSYPKYTASLFAGNSVWRSGVACGSVIFARPLFINMGVNKGVSLLGGLSVIGIFGTTAIYMFGKKLHARSRFAQS
ncbi:cycloheximide resistance protein [Penicillium lagena]|uniref:cycloheximide resistance protein n=1 Tax=Penicillium lagena TaxID=94218 RepID=UPI00253F78AD|nr:cycloheximide resistance protein [Penicillium lagena]KAJ5605316.1 cycloheximide resistance protein [Penicillium lagena]